MAMCSFDLGLGTGRFPELEPTHLIPARRLKLQCFEGIHEGFGYYCVLLDAIRQANAHPGKVRSTPFKAFALGVFVSLSGKSRVERHLRLAEERGGGRADQERARKGRANE
jgi:hypothetical protein